MIGDASDYRRRSMVEALRAAGVSDERVLEAMGSVPRHLFVSERWARQAYDAGLSINIGGGQTISHPLMVARMSEAAALTGIERVLEVGTGSGYHAAVLSRLARFVFTVERLPELARDAKRRLDRLGVENVSVKVMDGTLGWRGQAPYDAIVVTAAAPSIPEPLVEQLAEGGRLVLPVGGLDQQRLTVVRREGDRILGRRLDEACFVPLIGRHGWEDAE